ncbi:MAG TPA: hypothetical protein VGK83_08145 [Acidimicrobiia bacterium]
MTAKTRKEQEAAADAEAKRRWGATACAYKGGRDYIVGVGYLRDGNDYPEFDFRGIGKSWEEAWAKADQNTKPLPRPERCIPYSSLQGR